MYKILQRKKEKKKNVENEIKKICLELQKEKMMEGKKYICYCSKKKDRYKKKYAQRFTQKENES